MIKSRVCPIVLALVLVLGGCTLAPTYEQPQMPVPGTFPTGEAYSDVETSAQELPPWEKFFTNKNARQVIQMALENNRDLRVAMLNVDKARAQYGIQRSQLMPTVGAVGTETASKTPAYLAQGHSYVSHSYQANLSTASWEIDLFGRLRSLNEAALQNYFATAENRWAAQIELIAAVASAWINVGAQKQFEQLQRITLKSQLESYRLMQSSYRLGASSLLELEQAKTTVAQAKAALAAYQRELAQARNALELLVGTKVPEELEPKKLEDATEFGAIAPAGLSSTVLLNRPDIRAAENTLKAANANIGAARANFFPTISLTGGIGSASLHLSDLFTAGSGLWSFAPSISLPIFTGGANIAQLQVAEADKAIMVANYEKSIQNAFAEVSDALATEGTVKRQCAALKELVQATQNAYRLSQNRYKNGLDGFLTVLESQRQMVAAQTSLIASEQTRLNSNIMLYKVLGGGVPKDIDPDESGYKEKAAAEVKPDGV